MCQPYPRLVNPAKPVMVWVIAVCLPSVSQGAVILLENLRFHVEEEGKGKDSEGKKVGGVE